MSWEIHKKHPPPLPSLPYQCGHLQTFIAFFSVCCCGYIFNQLALRMVGFSQTFPRLRRLMVMNLKEILFLYIAGIRLWLTKNGSYIMKLTNLTLPDATTSNARLWQAALYVTVANIWFTSEMFDLFQIDYSFRNAGKPSEA